MPAILERCVRKVKAKGGNVDPWAVCSASTGWVKKKGGGWRKKKGKTKKSPTTLALERVH